MQCALLSLANTIKVLATLVRAVLRLVTYQEQKRVFCTHFDGDSRLHRL